MGQAARQRFVPAGREQEAARALSSIEAGDAPAKVAKALLDERIVPMDVYKILRSTGLSYQEAHSATEEAIDPAR